MVGESTVSLTVSVPQTMYDHITSTARAKRTDVAPFVRRILSEFLATDGPHADYSTGK